MKRKLLISTLAVALLAFAILQFIPQPPVQIPAQLPVAERSENRLLNFAGIVNFRDLGGYRTEDGRQVRWGTLYRAGNLSSATEADLDAIARLGLAEIIDFRSSYEREKEPNRLPEQEGLAMVKLPILDEGNNALASELSERIDKGDMESFDPDAIMIEANQQFASVFTPQFSAFMQSVLANNGQPMMWHCTAGKDRTGFASAILLRTLGVAQDTVMSDYLMSADLARAGRANQMRLLRVFKGQETADKVSRLLGIEAQWLEAAFQQIDEDWGSFERYRREGLSISDQQVEQLRALLLEPAA